MSYRVLEKNLPVHVISRAVEGRKLFNTEEYCYRFIFQMYAASIGKPNYNLYRKDVMKAGQALLNGENISSKFVLKEHSPLVEIIDFVLPITHFHLYLLPSSKENLAIFMKKLKGNFAKYFNLKNSRSGSLFDGPYKSVQVKTQTQSQAVIRYITVVNSLDVYQPGWRKKGLKNIGGAFKFLKDFQFSSFPDRIGKRKAKFLASPKIYKKYDLTMGGKKEFKAFVKDFLEEKFRPFESFFFE